MKRRMVTFLALFAVFGFAIALSAGDKPIVAVFDIEAKRINLSKSLVEAMNDHLATQLTATGKYQVVPREQLKRRLIQIKKKSHKECYDKSCQIEIGKELAAEKTLATQVIKIGKKCTVNATLFDLKKAATENAASVRCKCTEDDLLVSLNKVVGKLAGKVSLPETEHSLEPEPWKLTVDKKVVVRFESQPFGVKVMEGVKIICGKTP